MQKGWVKLADGVKYRSSVCCCSDGEPRVSAWITGVISMAGFSMTDKFNSMVVKFARSLMGMICRLLIFQVFKFDSAPLV